MTAIDDDQPGDPYDPGEPHESPPPGRHADRRGPSGPTPPAPRVAFQGEAGAYSHEAVEHALGASTRPVPCRDFRSLIRAVVEGEADLGMVPVENSLAGAVGGAIDALLDADLEPLAEVVRPIRHALLARPDADLDGIRRVLSHPVALAQCLGFFDEHPGIEAVAVHDTAGAARMVSEGADDTVAAIASEAAAPRYGLHVLARGLQDRNDNQTRFLVVRRPGSEVPVPTAGPPRCLAVFETDDRPGALADVLLVLARHGLNLSRLASRPGRDPWSYRFVAEVAADLRSGRGKEAIEAARARTHWLEVRGPYADVAASLSSGGQAEKSPLDRVRTEIDRLDERLVRLLAERARLARAAQEIRAEEGRGGFDPPREAEVVRKAIVVGREMGLPEEALRRVLWNVVALSGAEMAGARTTPRPEYGS